MYDIFMSRNDEILCLYKVKNVFLYNRSKLTLIDNSDGAIQTILTTCRPNPSDNDFPDFLFNGGRMEHFLIGSSKENRKGSEFNRAKYQDDKSLTKFLEEKKKDFLDSPPSPISFGAAVRNTFYDCFSYDAFLNSLERNFANHIESLKESDTELGTVVFLMEQQTPRLDVWENGNFARSYLLSEDKRALQILSKYTSEVRYVIYLAGDIIEAIDLSKLQAMMTVAKEDNDIRSGRIIKSDIFYTIDA